MDNILRIERIDNQQPSSEKYGYLYETTNLVNNKKYIGVHKSKKFDSKYKGSGVYLQKAIKKYGSKNFKTKVIRWCYSKEELFNLEKEYIEKYNCVQSSEYYNIADGGKGGCMYNNFSKDKYNKTIEKISKAKRNRPRTKKEQEHLDDLHKQHIGFKMSEESKEKSRQSNLGQKRSLKTRQNMSKNHCDCSGKNNSFYGKKHTKETRKKISKNNARAQKGKIWITNKVDEEYLIRFEELSNYPNFVRGRLRKNQKIGKGSTTSHCDVGV